MSKRKSAESQPVDWSTLNHWIAGEPIAADGLAKNRDTLEEIVGPYVTTKKTANIIVYRGKRCYLSDCGGQVHFAMQALQFLYGIEAAMQSGDIDRAVRMAVGFANANGELFNVQVWNTTSTLALAERARRKRGSKTGGTNSRKWTPDVEARALEIAPHFPKSKSRNRLIAERLTKDCGKEISAASVRRYLPKAQQ